MEIQHESSKFAKEVKNCGGQNFPFIIAAYIPNEMPLPVPLCKSFTLSKINMEDFAKKIRIYFQDENSCMCILGCTSKLQFYTGLSPKPK